MRVTCNYIAQDEEGEDELMEFVRGFWQDTEHKISAIMSSLDFHRTVKTFSISFSEFPFGSQANISLGYTPSVTSITKIWLWCFTSLRKVSLEIEETGSWQFERTTLTTPSDIPRLDLSGLPEYSWLAFAGHLAASSNLREFVRLMYEVC